MKREKMRDEKMKILIGSKPLGCCMYCGETYCKVCSGAIDWQNLCSRYCETQYKKDAEK
jgi:hypothetical protein